MSTPTWAWSSSLSGSFPCPSTWRTERASSRTCALKRNATRSMLSERGRRALLDMLENATAAQDFVQGLTVEAFIADRRTLYAVIRCLEPAFPRCAHAAVT